MSDDQRKNWRRKLGLGKFAERRGEETFSGVSEIKNAEDLFSLGTLNAFCNINKEI